MTVKLPPLVFEKEENTLRSLAFQVVFDAIKNKYEDLSIKDVRDVFDTTWSLGRNTQDEAELVRQLRPLGDIESDISNQTTVLQLIDRVWAPTIVLRLPIASVHSAVYGLGEEKAYRTSEIIADYGGTVPTKAAEVCPRLDELETLARMFIPLLKQGGHRAQAAFLAYMFAAIIRVHPFQDGNGRAARMFVQYSLRCWGQPFMPLPKVRNNPKWKAALARAVDGDATDLTDQLMQRMTEM